MPLPQFPGRPLFVSWGRACTAKGSFRTPPGRCGARPAAGSAASPAHSITCLRLAQMLPNAPTHPPREPSWWVPSASRGSTFDLVLVAIRGSWCPESAPGGPNPGVRPPRRGIGDLAVWRRITTSGEKREERAGDVDALLVEVCESHASRAGKMGDTGTRPERDETSTQLAGAVGDLAAEWRAPSGGHQPNVIGTGGA